MAAIVRDLEYRFDVAGLIFVVQVCSPEEHAAAPVTRSEGKFGVMVVTLAADDLASFHGSDPAALADRIVVYVRARMPVAPRGGFDAFRHEVVAWIGAHRQAAADRGK